MSRQKRPTLAIAGASGFVGQTIIKLLANRFHIIGLSRTEREPGSNGVSEWRRCDLFCMTDVEEALDGVDYAVYLVHSMMPRDRLTQGSFADLDVLLADNFARAARRCSVKQIVYLGGIIPDGVELSVHLQSRLEVETVLASTGVPVTTLRAGLILGEAGSSAQILKNLVRRLPIMACPRWVNTKTQPIVIDDVASIIAAVVAQPRFFDTTFDIAGPDVVTYRWLMERTGHVMGRAPKMVMLPFFNLRLSRLWLQLITGAPSSLVSPLIDSLRHEMVAKDDTIWAVTGLTPTPLSVGILALVGAHSPAPRAFLKLASGPTASVVRSVQRLPRPRFMNASHVAEIYFTWLPRFLRFLLTLETAGTDCRFTLRFLSKPLLVLRYMKDSSAGDRPLFRIVGGILADASPQARLEFRVVPGRDEVLASIHDFYPSLWWPLYRWGQAPVHKWVMTSFGRHLASDKQTEERIAA